MEVKKRKYFVITLIILLFLVPIISSATVVVNQPQPEQKSGWVQTYFGFLGSAIFWWAVIGFLIIVAILVGLFFLVRWIVKFLKSRNDIFYQLKKDRIKLAKIHGTYPSKHWWKIDKNTPIRLVTKNSGKLNVTSPIAYHRGNFTTHEGNITISMNLRGNNKWFVFPITSILIVPDKESINILKKDSKGHDEIINISNLPRAVDIVQFNEGEILIYAESLSNVGEFYVPVLKSKDNRIIDLSIPVFQSLKEVVIGNYLYQQTADFVQIAKKGISMNPNLSYEIKSKDANTNVEIPQTDRR